jgi:hypothetical protein
MVSEPEPTQQPLENLQRQISAGLMEQWNRGFCKGLQAAEDMATALVDSGELSEQQITVVLGLKFALQNSQKYVMEAIDGA